MWILIFVLFERMNAYLKLKRWGFSLGYKKWGELNISENIFDYITGWWSRQNEKLNSGDYKLEIQENGYCIIPTKIKEEPLKSRVGQFLIRGQHRYNVNILVQVYTNARPGNSLRYYIENLGTLLFLVLICFMEVQVLMGVGVIIVIMLVFYSSVITCAHNEILGSDSDLRGGEYWEKVLNRNGLPLVSIMNSAYCQ